MTRVFVTLDETNPCKPVACLHINGQELQMSEVEVVGLLAELKWASKCLASVREIKYANPQLLGQTYIQGHMVRPGGNTAGMKTFLYRLWYSLNYRFCRVESYLAANRGEFLLSADWQSKASEWQRKYLMCGRTLV